MAVRNHFLDGILESLQRLVDIRFCVPSRSHSCEHQIDAAFTGRFALHRWLIWDAANFLRTAFHRTIFDVVTKIEMEGRRFAINGAGYLMPPTTPRMPAAARPQHPQVGWASRF